MIMGIAVGIQKQITIAAIQINWNLHIHTYLLVSSWFAQNALNRILHLK